MLNTVNVLGVGISPINMNSALEIAEWIRSGDRQGVCTVAIIMECQRAEDLRRLVNAAGMRTPDGTPLVWLAHLRGHNEVTQVYGPDLMLAVMAQSAACGWRHYLCGGGPGSPSDRPG
jgi:N-acetylglucosaminyldiphosphoundecaprenol N-acetyl-beta-D-mannosaminyltransferase